MRRLGSFSMAAAALAGALFLAGCGGGGSTSGSTNNSSSGAINNVLPVALNASFADGYQNEPLVSVTVCVPGTAQCQTIPNVLLDTGSYGLRLLASQTTLALPAVDTAAGQPAGECAQFSSTFDWGPVVGADVELTGEKASDVPVQIMGSSSFAGVPAACTNTGLTETDTLADLGATGILGVGNYPNDCGDGCAEANDYPVYFTCPAGASCDAAPATMPLQNQVQNPVWLFPQDNNGVLVSLPAISASGAATVAGSLIFGIGTEANNGLGTASIYTLDDNGNIATVFGTQTYTESYLDSGSNGLFVLDAGTLGSGMADCAQAGYTDWYCPAATTSFNTTVRGANGVTGQAPFSLANAETLFGDNSGLDVAFDNLGGDNPNQFDFGLPFFFGRNVYVAIDGQNTPGGVGPYWAF